MTPITKTLTLMTIAISSVLAFDIHGTPEVCCDTKYYTLASEAKQLVKDLKAGKVDGEHHWFENGDTIWESDGATFSGKERADRLQKIIDKCTTDDGISVAGHDCLYDSNAICVSIKDLRQAVILETTALIFTGTRANVNTGRHIQDIALFK
ncbi:hypothetical protein E3Q24_03962 [Wallemia mellicola]|nr:hypothetical protein E3Q24_03962 [Wallemia mellicola]TIC12685.1 hypothetical protein E3Q13_04127 [Wallemia mellicola]